MPIYEESKHHWQSWFTLDKKAGPLWPAGLTKADWDKKKAVLATGKKAGITEVLQAAQKAFEKALAERKPLPTAPGTEREEAEKKAETYWKGRRSVWPWPRIGERARPRSSRPPPTTPPPIPSSACSTMSPFAAP